MLRVIVNAVAWMVALVAAVPVALVAILLLLLMGCTSVGGAKGGAVEAERACFSGTLAAYQYVGRDQKVSIVCK